MPVLAYICKLEVIVFAIELNAVTVIIAEDGHATGGA